MSKKIKGLVCALLAGMMVTTSCGLTSLAADEDTTSGAAAESAATETASPEATEAAEETTAEPEATEETAETATEAPAETTEAPSEEATEAPSTNAYDNDIYYQNALKVVSALGIIQGYEDGSVQPESKVTRAEMATIILRLINMTTTAPYVDVFVDVTSEHWAANNIQTAVEQGIVNGMGDGTFVPDGDVMYEQVIKMLVCALNYGTDAEKVGGYPNGYISVGGSSLSLLDSVNGQQGTALTRGEVIKAVFNALNAPYREIIRFENQNPVYSAKDTLGITKFKLYEEAGVLTATQDKTISAGVTTKDGRVVVDGVEYLCDLTDLDGLLGKPVEFYYIDSNSDSPKIIAMYESGNSRSYTFDAENISEMDYEGGSLRVYTSDTGSNTRRYDIGSATIMYNGSVLTSADFAASEYAGEAMNDFIVPEVGSVQIIDYDADGKYDVVMIDKYETMLVTTATAEKISGKIGNVDKVINVENDSNDKTINVTKSGSVASVRNLRKNDVASIKRNIDNTMIEIVVTGSTVTGSVENILSDDDEMTIVVNGQEYDVDLNAQENVRLGSSVILYLDQFDRVGFIESSTGSMLSANEKYAVIANAYVQDNGDPVVKLFNQDGEALTLNLASKLKFWGPNDTESASVSATSIIDSITTDGNFLQCDGSPVKLCKYRVNNEGQISLLYFAVAATDDNANTDALRMYVNGTNTSLSGVASVGGAVSGYYIEDGIVEFTIPNTASDRTDPNNYSVGEARKSTYTVYDGGATISYAIADFVNTRYPSVLVRFEAGANSVSPVTDIDTAANSGTFILSRVVEAVDADDNQVFRLIGYTGGAEVSYTTASNTGVYDIDVADMASQREYKGTCIFDATKDDPEDFTSAVNIGDIFIVGGNGKTLGRLVNVEDVALTAATGQAAALETVNGVSYNQGSRDTYFSGFVTEVDISDSAFLTLSSFDMSSMGGVAYDTSAVFNYVTLTVDANGRITNTKVDESGGIEPGEVLCFGDDPTEFDYGFFKLFKGNMQNGYIIRVRLAQ